MQATFIILKKQYKHRVTILSIMAIKRIFIIPKKKYHHSWSAKKKIFSFKETYYSYNFTMI